MQGDTDIVFLNADPPAGNATIAQDLSRQPHPAVYCAGIVGVDPDVPEATAVADHFGGSIVFDARCNHGWFTVSGNHQPLFAAPGDHPEITVIQGVVDRGDKNCLDALFIHGAPQVRQTSGHFLIRKIAHQTSPCCCYGAARLNVGLLR